MKKRIFSLVLAVALLMQFAVVSAFAADEYPDNQAGAVEIQLGTLYETTVDSDDDADWVKFTTPAYDCYVHAKMTVTSGSANPTVEIYDANANRVAREYSYTESTSADTRLKADTVYYAVFYGSAANSEYTFSVTAHEDKYPDTQANAVEIELGTLYETTSDGTNDADWVKFTTPDYDSYVHAKMTATAGDLNPTVEIYDAAGNRLSRDYTYVDETNTNTRLKANTVYYAVFYGATVGDYTFSITAHEDKYPDKQASAVEVEIGTLYETTSDGTNDPDWVKFTTPAYDCYVRAKMSVTAGDINPTVEIYDAAGNRLAREYTYSESTSADTRLKANTVYYAVFYGASVGEYTFSLTAYEDKYPDKQSDAIEVELGTLYETTVDGTNDPDWVKFTTADYDAYYIAKMQTVFGTANPTVEIYDAAGNRLARNYSYSNEVATSKKLNPNTVYYAVFYGSTNDEYTFSITAVPDEDADIFEKATAIALAEKMDRTLATDEDVDWFKVEVAVKGNYELSVYNENCSSIKAELYNSREAEITELSTYSTDKQLSKTMELDVGTYYIKVSGAAGNYTAKLRSRLEGDVNGDGVVNEDDVLYGDVNHSGDVESQDALLVLQYYAKLIGADKLDLAVASVDGNADVDSSDALLILQYYAKLISEFPIESM